MLLRQQASGELRNAESGMLVSTKLLFKVLIRTDCISRPAFQLIQAEAQAGDSYVN